MLLIVFFHALIFYNTKKTEQQYLVIISLYRVQASEPQVNLRYQPIVVSEVGL